ncbi:MAG TPA: heme-binding protein [Longimicrobiales bacterium]
MRIKGMLGTMSIVFAVSTLACGGEAQQQAVPAARITLAEAGRAVDAAEAEAQRNNWKLTFVIADAEGTPIYVRRMDGATKQSYEIAMNKVSTSLKSGMHTVDYAAAVRANRIPAIEGAFMYEGGLLMKRDGGVIGAFSASGARGAEDAQAVKAGMAAIGIQP